MAAPPRRRLALSERMAMKAAAAVAAVLAATAEALTQPVVYNQPIALPGPIFVFPEGMPAASAPGGGGPGAAPGPGGPSPGPAPAPAPAFEPPPLPTYEFHGSDWTQGTCGSRLRQSPVNFERLLARPPSQFLDYHYVNVTGFLKVKASGGMLVADMSAFRWGGVSYKGNFYPLQTLVIHGPAEHLINNFRNPIEIQLIHRSYRTSAESLIISIPVWSEIIPEAPNASLPYTYMPPNPFEVDFNKNLQNLISAQPPSEEGSWTELYLPGLDLAALVETPAAPDSGTYFNYRGSLTSPPCLDSATWFVRRASLVAGSSQVKALADALYQLTNSKGSYRNVMPWNQRFLNIYRLRYAPTLTLPAQTGLNWGPNPRTDSEYEVHKFAEMANDKAINAGRYVEDFARRLRKADNAFARALYKPPTAPPPGPTQLERELRYQATVRSVRAAITDAARDVQKTVDTAIRGQATSVYKAVSRLHKEAKDMVFPTAPPGPSPLGPHAPAPMPGGNLAPVPAPLPAPRPSDAAR